MTTIPKEGVKVVVTNRSAFAEFEILDKYEAGIVLQGTEVKSIRDGKISLKEAYAKLTKGEIWLVQCHITPYPFGNRFNHDPLRPRKLLLKKAEIRKLVGKIKERGLTLVPLRVYFKNGLAKLELGLGRGKKIHDKRKAIRDRDVKREVAREFKDRGRH